MAVSSFRRRMGLLRRGLAGGSSGGRGCRPPDGAKGHDERLVPAPRARRGCSATILSAAGPRLGRAASCRDPPPDGVPAQPGLDGAGEAVRLAACPRALHDGGTLGPAVPPGRPVPPGRDGALGACRDGALGPAAPLTRRPSDEADDVPADLASGGSGGADGPVPLPPAGPAAGRARPPDTDLPAAAEAAGGSPFAQLVGAG